MEWQGWGVGGGGPGLACGLPASEACLLLRPPCPQIDGVLKLESHPPALSGLFGTFHRVRPWVGC